MNKQDSSLKDRFDIAIIGAGPGGYVAAIRAAQLGMSVALIEKDSTLGGTCLNVGCIPSKALLQSTDLYQQLLKEGKIHGIEYDSLNLNFQQMMKRKAQVVQSLVSGVAGLIKRHQITRFEAKARLQSPHSIAIGNNTSIEAQSIILATGSTPVMLPFLPFDEKSIISSTGALNLSTIPKKLIIVGAGVIGVELASVYARIGSEVVVIEMLDRICPMIDLSISKMLMQTLKKQGISFHLSTKVMHAKTSSEGISVSISEGGESSVITGNIVLVAVGRQPYTEGLNLAEIGVNLSSKGFVVVDSLFRTSIPSIFAIGDLIEGPMLAHKAFEEGVATAEIIAGQQVHPINYLAIPNVIYTNPEVAVVGLTEKEARDEGLNVLVGTFPFRGNARARCSGAEEGLVKIVGEVNSGRLLGMHIMGSHASEMIGEGVMAMQKKATIRDIAYSSHAHPTYTEAIKEAALDALGGLTLHL